VQISGGLRSNYKFVALWISGFIHADLTNTPTAALSHFMGWAMVIRATLIGL
jgi:hypothetical protein